jgi:hypothetical protein
MTIPPSIEHNKMAYQNLCLGHQSAIWAGEAGSSTRVREPSCPGSTHGLFSSWSKLVSLHSVACAFSDFWMLG